MGILTDSLSQITGWILQRRQQRALSGHAFEPTPRRSTKPFAAAKQPVAPIFCKVRNANPTSPMTNMKMKRVEAFKRLCRYAALPVAILFAGCAVPIHQQRLVSKANMQFSSSPVFNYQSRTLSQIESGAAATGGAQAAGCTSCR